ncbi:MAG: hypothetical protein ACYDCK_13860 [Thermoplasmatota archaeon]
MNEGVGLIEIGLLPNERDDGIRDYIATEGGPALPVNDLTDIILVDWEHTEG